MLIHRILSMDRFPATEPVQAGPDATTAGVIGTRTGHNRSPVVKCR